MNRGFSTAPNCRERESSSPWRILQHPFIGSQVAPVDRSYADKSPFAFTGTVKKVVFDINPHRDPEHEQEPYEHAHQALATHAIHA